MRSRSRAIRGFGGEVCSVPSPPFSYRRIGTGRSLPRRARACAPLTQIQRTRGVGSAVGAMALRGGAQGTLAIGDRGGSVRAHALETPTGSTDLPGPRAGPGCRSHAPATPSADPAAYSSGPASGGTELREAGGQCSWSLCDTKRHSPRRRSDSGGRRCSDHRRDAGGMRSDSSGWGCRTSLWGRHSSGCRGCCGFARSLACVSFRPSCPIGPFLPVSYNPRPTRFGRCLFFLLWQPALASFGMSGFLLLRCRIVHAYRDHPRCSARCSSDPIYPPGRCSSN